MKKITIYIIIFIFTLALFSCGIVKNKFKDKRDKYIYKTVKIGEQIWFAENLAYKANDGCWAFENDESNVEKYGYLYNWETAKKVCPKGWHLPTDAEWKELEIYLGLSQEEADKESSRGTIGKKLKTTQEWTPEGSGTNESKFSALPAGYRNGISGIFDYLGENTNFWTSSDREDEQAWSRSIFDHNDKVFRSSFTYSNGYSVRCIKDK